MDYLIGHKHHVKELEKIVKDSGEQFEGNCFYYHHTFNSDDTFMNKHRNIMDIARKSNKIVEIGFNAGHSSFLMLVANPDCHIHAFDICSHSYVKPCLEYLNVHFGNRITLHEGNSHETLREFQLNNPDYRFDAIHIDGCHEYLHANLDFFISKGMSRPGAYCILDDTNIGYLLELWNGYIRDNHITELAIRGTGAHKHSIGKYK